ncbi:MAG: phosphoglucosamine mutase [Erysipelotrichaceae bacterium]|nr:phosphoglucosamine mutase [Erysipelotrichaceae bacterium]
MGRYFGTDGVRGRANKTLNIETVYNIGRFVGYYYGQNKKAKIVIGMDTRLSSSMFEYALASAMSSSGADVYLVGYCSTPCLAYTTMHEKFSCGVMISASHNPYYDNGVKIFGPDGLKIKDDIEGLIEDYIDNPTTIKYKEDDQIGKIIEYKQAVVSYQNWLNELYQLDLSEMKLVVDLCNGSNCYTAKDVLANTHAQITYINDNPNGTNINNGCGSTHLESLIAAVKEGQYDLGFAFDGDADRVLFVNQDGDVVDGDNVMYLLAKYLKDIGKLKGNTLVTTVMSNIGLYKALTKVGIDYDITPVGDKSVIDSIIKNKFVIGGEQSGHIIYSEDSCFGDGLKTALLLLKALKHFDCSLKEAVKELRIYPQLLVNEKVKDKNVVLNDEQISKLIANIAEELGNNGRILVRPSGTEPLIRVMVEAENDELCNKYVYQVIDMIKEKGYAES